ncbi:MAG: T9SS type A sorting domain-containing protein [bacterium]|nr:T9SS type A sorting domain-containing protein [bacterium]
MIRSGDAGVTWHVSSALLAGYEYKAIQAELQNVDAIWAILSNGETWRLDLRSDRYVNQGIIVGSWVDANIQGMKLFTEFSIAQVNGPSLSRVFWSISSYNGQPFLAEDPTQVRFYERWVWGTPYPPDDVVYVVEPVTIPIGETLTIPAGSELVFLNEGKITVDGTMVIGSNQGPVTVLRSNDDSDPSARWQGLVVNGSITMENCELKGAETGIETSKANSLILSGSTISKCGTGLLAYQPSGTAFPQITGCTFSNNDNYGASLLSTVSTTFDECIFTGNGADGMLLTNSYAKIISCDFTDNGEAQGGYGLNCFGSSPMLSCNNFDENKKGEIVLYNQSYPAMEPSGGGGKNTLFNSARNLIEMWSSYPLTKNGHNNFKVGGTGYFMADMSAAPKKRDISGNYWNPSLGLSKLYPSSSSVYTWNSIDGTVNSCGGTGSGSGAGAAQQMFADGIAEQSSGNYSAANTLLADVVTQYPDSEWANAALAQMFVTQCMVGDGYPTLQTYMNDIPDDSTLAEPAEVFATRLWVEDEQYAPALETYEATMTNPPSEVDSIFAAVDFAVATYRAQAEGGSLDEVNSADVKDIFRQLDMVSTTIPPSPEASHEGFAVIPTEVALEANFPNPFNAETTIRYYLPEAQFAEVSIFNIVGQKVATLVSGQMSAGFHDVHWSGSDLASGVYLYQLKTGGAVETRKMVLLK